MVRPGSNAAQSLLTVGNTWIVSYILDRIHIPTRRVIVGVMDSLHRRGRYVVLLKAQPRED